MKIASFKIAFVGAALAMISFAALVPANASADSGHPRHKICVHYLTCESPYCGETAYQKCLNGEDPTGFSLNEFNSGEASNVDLDNILNSASFLSSKPKPACMGNEAFSPPNCGSKKVFQSGRCYGDDPQDTGIPAPCCCGG